VRPVERATEPMVRGASGPRLVTAIATVAALSLVGAGLWAARRDGGSADDTGDVVRVGVVPGQSVPGYLTSSRAELATLTDPSAPATAEVWALVSLDRYVAPGVLPEMLSGTATAEAYARVPLPGVHTQVVRLPVYRLPADVASGMLDAALQRDREQAEYARLSGRVTGDGAGQRRARGAYDSAARTAAAEAQAYRSGCSCVFAAVVRGDPAGLDGIAHRAGVRAVDPAPEVRRLDRAEFRPPLPEQAGTVPSGPGPPSAAVPRGSSGIASRTPAPILSALGAAVTSAATAGTDREPDPHARAPEERTVVPSEADASAAQDATRVSPAAPRGASGR
jgi:hypothetical protein